MDELPKLPFEKVLSYLSLKDRLKARTVSRAWRNKFDSYPVRTLCYSSRPSDFILGKSRWVSGAFATNFINSTQFATFFDTYGQTILSSLKHLRLCDLELSKGDRTAFTRILNSFSQLEQLDIIETEFDETDVFNLNLPMLTSLQLENVRVIPKLTLEAPRLREVKILNLYRTDLRLEIVDGESVERLFVDGWEYTQVKKLKNLQYLYVKYLPIIDPTFLSSLQYLKEIYTNDPGNVPKLFEQKQQSGRADLKIYLCGLLLNGPDDPAINALRNFSSHYLSGRSLAYLAESPFKLADEIPFYSYLKYSSIEGFVSPSLEVDLLKRFTDLNMVTVNGPVQDIERFLNLLKNFENITLLWFECDHPQDLFDRLPEHCAVQKLTLFDPPSDFTFLFLLKHLTHLTVHCSIDSETIRRAFEELPVLSSFSFRYGHKITSIEIDQSKQFQVSVLGNEKTPFSGLNTAIKFITGNEIEEAQC